MPFTRTWPSSPIWSYVRRHVALSLILNAAGPLVVYMLLRPHMTELAALSAALLLPAGEGVVTVVRHRKLNIFGLMVGISIVCSIAVVVLGGSPRMLLLRESLLSGVFGVVMLLSLLSRQPLVYYIARHFAVGPILTLADTFHHKASVPWFRSFLRLLTLVWGLLTTGDALINAYLATSLPIPTYLLVTPIVRYGTMGTALVWTLVHAYRGRYLTYLFADEPHGAATATRRHRLKRHPRAAPGRPVRRRHRAARWARKPATAPGACDQAE
ncbi:MAG TPA: VC0807 family protein [Chloroflexota bacterium]|nr:VC0807 family protein [Chloroflexota bacterium]